MRLPGLDPVRGMSPAEAAAYWQVRHDRGPLTPGDRAAFARWLAASPGHARAWEQAGRLWNLFDEPDDRHLRAMCSASLAKRPRRHLGAGAIGAGLAACGALLFVVVSMPDRPGGGSAANGSAATSPVSVAAGRARRYQTARGEQLSVTLADESVLTLDTDTAVDVLFAGAARQVRLVRGQALFDVAKDASRPFTVVAGDRRITALGTKFDVSIDPASLEVVLVEGRVAVSHARPTPAAVAAVILRPGEKLTAQPGERGEVSPADVQAATMWRHGMVSLEDVTLAEAVAVLNRYSTRRITIADPDVAALRVSGVFRTGAPDGFIASVAEVLPVTSRPVGDGLEIILRPSPPRPVASRSF